MVEGRFRWGRVEMVEVGGCGVCCDVTWMRAESEKAPVWASLVGQHGGTVQFGCVVF